MKQAILSIFLGILSLIATSCNQSSLTVRTEYYSRASLASYVLGTPDPNKETAQYGERLFCYWDIPNSVYQKGPIDLVIRMKMENQEEIQKTIPIDVAVGTFRLPVLGDDYIEKGEIYSYLVELRQNNQTISSSRSHFWVEPIIIKGK